MKTFKINTRVYCSFTGRFYKVKQQKGVKVFVRKEQWIHVTNLVAAGTC